MTAAERRALLGDSVITQIRDRVALAPVPTAAVVDDVRRIVTRPAAPTVTVPTPRAA